MSEDECIELRLAVKRLTESLRLNDVRLTELLTEFDRLKAEAAALEAKLPLCGERPPVPWFTACVARYGHQGMHQFAPLQTLYSTERCDTCGNDRAAWDALLKAYSDAEREHSLSYARVERLEMALQQVRVDLTLEASSDPIGTTFATVHAALAEPKEST